MLIRTKIVATVGPACGDVKKLRALAEAGCDVFRINFSHGSNEQREKFLINIRQVESELGEPLGVIADLCGPKIRVGPITGGAFLLARGQEIIIQREPVEGTVERISITRRELVDEIAAGELILINDGRIRLEVIEVRPPEEILCKVLRGGILSSGKGVNLPTARLKLAALTEKDLEDARWIAKHDFDYVALSFVREADDIIQLRTLLKAAGSDTHIIAKIEKPQAIENIDEITEAADVIMVARGDLGVEMDLPQVPVTQKRIASICHKAGVPCIIATQMLESMTESHCPTRAEVSDVANAVLDHADAVMLSGETAIGKYPVDAVSMMDDIVRETEVYHDENYQPMPISYPAAPTTAAMARAVHEIIAAEDIKAVAVFSSSGASARILAKNRLPCPILAMSPQQHIARRTSLYYGVQSVQADPPKHTRDVLELACKFVKQFNLAAVGDKIVVMSGRPIGQAGASNTLVVHTVQ